MSGSDQEQNQGIVPADPQQAPFPIVILFNGVHCNPELYKWLAIKLSERGIVVVTFAWVTENFPGIIAMTPGVNIGLFCSTPMVAVSRNISRKKIMEMLLTGEKLSAHEAVQFGLINK